MWIGQSSTNTYNSNGTPNIIYDLANVPTTYSYTGTYIGCGGCTNFPFPTSITKGGLTISSAWYGVGGVKSTDVDASGNKTMYCYNTGGSCAGGTADPYWRRLQTIDPYGSTVLQAYPTGSSPDSSGTSFTFNSGNSIESVTNTTDGYGRIINSQKAQSPQEQTMTP